MKVGFICGASEVLKVFAILPPDCKRNLLVLFLAGLLFWSALASLLPTLPLYIAEMGRNSEEIGIIMGSFVIGLLFFRAGLAQLADDQGRKIVLLIGMAAVTFAPIGYLLTDAMALLIGVRAFHGISIAAFALAYSALVVDLSPPESRGELIGYMSLVNPIGMALGPAVGGLLHAWFGFAPSFLAATAAGLMGLVCTAHVYAPAQPGKLTSQNVSGQFWRMLNAPHVRTPALVLLLVGLAFGTLITFVPLLIEEARISLNVGMFYAVAAIASFGIRLIAGRASDRHGRGLFITFSLILYALAMAIIWRARSTSAFLLAGLFEGSGAGILIPMMAALMADRSYPDERGRTYSLCMVGFDLGIAIAGPMMGAIANHTSYQFIFGIAAALAFLGLLVFLTLSGKDLSQSFRFATGQSRDIYAVENLPFT
jgi:MFS family permease